MFRKLMWNVPASILFVCMIPTIIIGIVAGIAYIGLRIGMELSCDIGTKIFTEAI